MLFVWLYALALCCCKSISTFRATAIWPSASGRILGFQFPENFNYPYISASVTEFWRQVAHDRLARWFRDYLYIPLGGSRKAQGAIGC